MNCTLLYTVPDPLGRFVISKVQVDDKVYVLTNIYAPNKYILLQTENLDSEGNVIVRGDFNCPTLDKRGGTMVPRKLVVNSIECLQK